MLDAVALNRRSVAASQSLTLSEAGGGSSLLPLSPQQAVLEANRCLFCHDAPCIQACPTGIDVPLFIKQVATNNLQGAADTIVQANLFGYSCGGVCPTQQLCEGACVLNDRHEAPIRIGVLQQQAMAEALAQRVHPALKRLIPFVPHQEQLAQRRVAIIGGGPAGLSAAYELTQAGVAVTVYEQRASLGGLNHYGVAPYKLSVPHSEKEVAWLCEAGFEVKLNHHITLDRDVDALDEVDAQGRLVRVSFHDVVQQYDATLLAVGLGASHALAHLNWSQQVQEAKHWLEEARLSPETSALQGKNVVVIGGGNTAMDAAIRAAQLGASVTVAYRRKLSQISAYPQEVNKAKAWGVQFVEQALPISYDAVHGQLTLEVHHHSDVLMPLPADRVLVAVGQQSNALKDAQRWLPEALQTKVHFLGDVANGGKEVVHAVEDAKQVVQSLLKDWCSRPAEATYSHPTHLAGSAHPVSTAPSLLKKVAAAHV